MCGADARPSSHGHVSVGPAANVLCVMFCECFTFLPILERLLGNAVAAGKDESGFCTGSDLGAYGRRGAIFLCRAIGISLETCRLP